MFMLALAAGFVANAGTVSWSFWDDNASASSDYILYLMEGTLTDGAEIAGITDATSAASYVASAAGSGLMDHTDALYVEGETGAFAAGSKSFYALIFNNTSIDTATEYLVVGSFTANVPGSGSAVFGNDITDRTASGWQSFGGSEPVVPPTGVPEPTSGLLMLVGLGALALRRRRA
jgi:hypothetical protein